MARQLDFSPLDFRQAILADPAGKAISKTIQTGFQAAQGAIEERRAKKEAIKKDFIEQMTYDTSITGNNIINNRVAYEYQKLRDKHLKVLSERKGWLKPEDLINLRSDMMGLSSLANELKSTQSLYENARRMAITKDGRSTFDLDTQKWGDLMSIISNDDTTDNLLEKLNEIKQSDSEFPFLNYRPYDLNILEKEARKAYRQEYKGDISQETVKLEKGGKKHTTNVKTVSYGDDNSARGYLKTSLLGNPNSINYTKGLQSILTEDQKNEAMQLYGAKSENPSMVPFVDYYINNMFDPKKFTKDVTTTQTISEPIKATGTGTGKGLTLIFGGGKETGPNEYAPQQDQVEGVKFNEYVEFAKAGKKPKSVDQVTVKGAQLLTGEGAEPAGDITEPNDYLVIGYDAEKDMILLSQKLSGGFYQTYMAPRKDNEHFLQGLLSEETLKSLGNGKIPTEIPNVPKFKNIPEGGF